MLGLAAAAARSPHDEASFFYYRYTTLEAVRSGPWKLVLPRPDHPAQVGWSGRFDGSGVGELSLFNLRDDIGEAKNVAAEHPAEVERLQAMIAAAREDLGDHDRIGKGARFFDAEPKPSRGKAKPKVEAGGSPTKAGAYDGAKPLGNLRFTFEGGDDGWTVAEGAFGDPFTDRDALPNHRAQPFNKEGKRFVFTGHQAGRPTGDDRFTGVLQSPPFILKGDRASFLVGGGSGAQTYVALCDAAGKELRRASGQDSPALQRVVWDVGAWKGQTLRLKIVDRSQGGWGHVTFDDFSCEGELAE